MPSSLSVPSAIVPSEEIPTLYRIACFLMVLHAFFLPLSTTITNVFFFSFIALWLLEKNAVSRWQFYFSYPLIKPLLCLVGLALVGIFYSTGEGESVLHSTSQILRLSTIPILAYYLQTNNPYKKFVLVAFVFALLLTILATFLKVYGGIPIGHRTYENNIFKNHIVISYFMAMGAFFLALWLKEYRQYKSLLFSFIAFTLYYFIFFNTGRTGYIILYICLTVFAWHQYGPKGTIIGFLGLSLIMLFAYYFSAPFSMRITELYKEFELYHGGEAISPTGARLDFIVNSYKLLLQHPFWGTGTGSFMSVYKAAFASELTVLTDNPHNQYLNNLIEWGVIGLFVLLWLFYRQWRCIQKLFGIELILAQGIFLSFFIGCLFNSWIKNFTECHFYCLMTAYFIPLRSQCSARPIKILPLIKNTL